MDSASSHIVTAHDFVAYGGGLFGLGVLLHQMSSGASLEQVVSSAVMSGLLAYLTLAAAFAAARSIVASAPDSSAQDESSNGSSKDVAAETDDVAAETDDIATETDDIAAETDEDDQTAPEPQAA
jgi:hypothetical protein